MSLQVFLQAQLLGADKFLARQASGGVDTASDLTGRCAWLTLLFEVVPRALLAELKLSRMLLGSSSAEQFLLVLAEEEIPRANDFLEKASTVIARVSGDALRLVWASTENLGAWPVVRKRLDDALEARVCCPAGKGENSEGAEFFAAFVPSADADSESAFADFANGLISANSVGWSSDDSLLLAWDRGTYTWLLREHSTVDEDGILFPRRFAMDQDGGEPAPPSELGERAEGADRWGMLIGDVDHFAVQLRRAGSVEEHIHFSALSKEFLAGELAVLCTLPEFWRKVTVLYRGGEDFAVMGSWDALILLARELQRLYEKFVEQHLAGLPGVEAKTISMALALAPDADAKPEAVLADAYAAVRATKSSDPGAVYLFGRTLEWKRLSDAEELKTSLVRMVREFRFPAGYLDDLASVYRETFAVRAGRRGRNTRPDKPWRIYMRVSRVIPPGRGKEQNNVRSAVITNLLGKRTAGMKLRPAARIGLEWARLEASA